MVQEAAASHQSIPEELYNLTQLAEVTLAAGRLSTTNVTEITEYINKEKCKQQPETKPAELQEFTPLSTYSSGSHETAYRRRHTLQDNWNRNMEGTRDDLLIQNRTVQHNSHSVIKRNHSSPTMLDYNMDQNYVISQKTASNILERTGFLSSSDDDSNYYSHKIFDRKKSRRSTISDNSKHDELSCSSLPSSGDEHFSQLGGYGHRQDANMSNAERSGMSSNSPSSDDDHICPECGKKYSTSSNLARHRQTHRSIMDKKARRCPHCDKVYVSMPAYSMHVRTHNQGCECPHCGKCFSRPWLLQGHIRTHTGEKPFKCNICSKAFADKSNLRAHVQTHSNTKPHACSRCGKAFALKSYLYKHEESSCMRNHAKHDKDRSKISRGDTTRSHLVSKILRKESCNAKVGVNSFAGTLPTQISSPNCIESNSLNLRPEATTDEVSEKSYTMLTSPMSQDDFDRFSRISVIRTPQTTQCSIGLSSNNEASANANIYDPSNSLQLNFYQENPVDFSPKNGFTHSSKTSPFEITGSYAIVA